MPEVAAIVVAAGQGTRMSPAVPVKKQFRSLRGKRVVEWAVESVAACPEVQAVVVVTGAGDVEFVRRLFAGRGESKVAAVVAGGPSRRLSVASGLAALPADVRWVVVHDGARPLVTPALVGRVLAAARAHGAATAALPVSDTLKRVGPDGRVLETVDRSTLWAVQTPQAFARDLLDRAHAASAGAAGPEATDDAGLVERLGQPVHVVPGNPANLKVTTEEDLEMAESLLAADPGCEKEHVETVTGFGFDIHRLVPDRPLILGGVRIEHTRGLLGHSDADVLAHAVIDALLGAAALGDIGSHFPDSDPAYKGADSLKLLRAARDLLVDAGCRIVHVDAFVSAQAPRLAPYIPAMRARLAEAMGIETARVSVKAGTGEGVGPVGSGEVIEARAVATVRRRFAPSDAGGR